VRIYSYSLADTTERPKQFVPNSQTLAGSLPRKLNVRPHIPT
jgi:hypothetical protein